LTAKCAKGQMFSKGQPVSQASCIGGAYTVSGKAASQIACGTPCDACTALLNDGLTCPDGHTCTTVSEREGQCSEAYCPSGIMTADGVEVDSLTCNGQSQWVDAGGTTYTAAQCELSCLLCTTLTNTGMACPEGLICSPPSEKEDGCKETYCPTGTMTASSERTSVTSLTCNGKSQWVDDEKTVFTSAQCETREFRFQPVESYKNEGTHINPRQLILFGVFVLHFKGKERLKRKFFNLVSPVYVSIDI
uniref:TNFR-Cys domain-containing protein n=1 Tax=Heligmosomoides polygyrus TaxID=6339 RepID=A0A183GWN5_HELPZ